MRQAFLIYVRCETNVSSGDEPYLTEDHVKKQIEKFLKGRSITEGLPCHGDNTIQVTEAIEVTVQS